MFKTGITSTPLTTDAANSYFQNIVGQKYGGDNSFLATLRALVAPRIKEGERIELIFGRSDYNSSTIRGVSANSVCTAICGGYSPCDVTGQIVVHSFTSDRESNIANMEVLKENLSSIYDGYHMLEKVTEFYRKSFRVDCYINPELKNVMVFVDNLDNKKLHYLQVSILAFLPWYFNPAEGVSQVEMELIYSLRETSPDKYEDCLAKIAEQYDFRTGRIRQLLEGFELRYERMEVDRTKEKIVSTDEEINRLNNAIGALLTKRNEICIRLMGLEQKIANGGEDSEIMDYFICNNRLYLEHVTDTDMYFCVSDYLEYFDREMAERAIDNERSFVYSGGHRGSGGEKMKKLLREIFVSDTPRLKIKFCAAYRFDLNGSVGTQGAHSFPHEFRDCMPNPHIDRWNCMGNYTTTINQLLQNRDYIGAIEQCVASCKSLNWGDSTVMETFMSTMWGGSGYNNRCIELPDGSVVKPSDAIKWLEQQEADNGETEEA